MSSIFRSSRALPPVARAGLATLLAAGCGLASATEYGTVTAVTPATQQAGPSRECWQQEHLVQPPTTGGGAVAGAVVGGVIGHGIGGGPVGTALGAVLGAGIGNNAEAASTPPAAYSTTRCRDVAGAAPQTVYDVQYDYNGQHYSVKMASDPGVGARIPLDVTPVNALPPAGTTAAAPANGAPPRVTYVYPSYGYAYPAYYPAYYPYPYVYPSVSIGFGPRIWVGGRWGWRHW